MLYAIRDKLWDISSNVHWIRSAQPYYEIPVTVDRYDAEKSAAISTMKHPTSAQLVALMKTRGIRSVLDIGCGAGAFYKLASSQIPNLRYLGIDASEAQISRAVANYGDFFFVKDASSLSVEYISSFKAIHVYSVLPFMSVDKQISLIGKIRQSGALCVLSVASTKKSISFMPRNAFRNQGRIQTNGGVLLTAVSYPYRDEINLPVEWSEIEQSPPHSVNSSERDGGAVYHGRPPRFPKKPKTLKLLTGVIQLGR